MRAVLPASEGVTPDALYHFSEDPSIEVFKPRPGRAIEGRLAGEQLVWTIDEFHAPMYFFPRDCPRIILWARRDSSADDVERWIGSKASMVAHVEARWLSRIRSRELHRYRFDPTPFESIHDHGTHVSLAPVTPLDVEPVGDLEAALAAANVELRVQGTLQPVAEAWFTSLHYSAIRMRNARDWTPPV